MGNWTENKLVVTASAGHPNAVLAFRRANEGPDTRVNPQNYPMSNPEEMKAWVDSKLPDPLDFELEVVRSNACPLTLELPP